MELLLGEEAPRDLFWMDYIVWRGVVVMMMGMTQFKGKIQERTVDGVMPLSR